MDFATKTIRFGLAAAAVLLLAGFEGGSCGDAAGGGSEAPGSTTVNLDPDRHRCGPVCAIQCDHGNVLDENGCPTCACNPPPGRGGGDGCPPVTCELWCEHGWARGPDGCAICACEQPPAGPDCPDLACDVRCVHGYVLDDDGCPTCACNPAPGDHCNGLDEQWCNATPGCLGIYDPHPNCACTPCPPGVSCFCDCPEGWGPFSHCVLDQPGRPDRPTPRPQPCNTHRDCGDEQSCVDGYCQGGAMCRTDADCPRGQLCAGNFCVVDHANPRQACRTDADCADGSICRDFYACMAIGCPPPGRYCDDPQCNGDEVATADGGCARPDGVRADPYCCYGDAGR